MMSKVVSFLDVQAQRAGYESFEALETAVVQAEEEHLEAVARERGYENADAFLEAMQAEHDAHFAPLPLGPLEA